MTVAGGGSGVSGVSKDKTQPLLIRHDSPLFTVPLGAPEGGRRLELNAEGKTESHVYQTNRQSSPELPSTGSPY